MANLRAAAQPSCMGLLLQPAPLLTLAALALAIAASLTTAPAGLFLLAILLSWTLKYSIALLDALVSGARAMPVLSIEMVVGSLRQWRLLIALGLLVLLFFLASATLGLHSRVLLVPLAAALPIALPAVLSVQGWTHDTTQALRPTVAANVARLLGADYLRLVALTAALVVVIVIVATRVWFAPLRIAVYLACWFALVVQTGQTLRRRRTDLEAATFFDPPHDLTPTAEQLAAARERAADEIYALWRNGAKNEAWAAAERYARSARHPAEELLWLQRRVSHWGAKPLEERIAAAVRAAMQ